MAKISAIYIGKLRKDFSVEVLKHLINLTHGLSQEDIRKKMK